MSSETSRVAIVMSRMPRLIDPAASWLQGLRACLRRIRELRQIVLVSPGTAGADFVIRGAERFGIPIEPAVDAAALKSSTLDSGIPDRLLVNQADELLVLAVRPRGNVHRLLLERLQSRPAGRVCLIDLPDLQSASVRESLLSLGATVWTPDLESRGPIAAASSDLSEADCNPVATSGVSILPLAPLPEDAAIPYLTHTTRACPGPWPQQTPADYWDSVLDQRLEADHSALHTLRRIVMQRRLLGSGRTIRGGYAVVSFTANPLRDLPALRCFRTHRARWDFEPYAVCIRKDVLEQRGARSAIYGGERKWASLTDAERPYFQLSGNSDDPRDDRPHQDWSIEREWRYQGDLDLTGLTVGQVVVLVPTVAAARALQPYSPWPLTLWPCEVD